MGGFLPVSQVTRNTVSESDGFDFVRIVGLSDNFVEVVSARPEKLAAFC
jgi:hypothetical protein